MVFLVIAIVVSFMPVMGYFFAQDDFILMDDASNQFGRTLTHHFGSAPGQFRPLSKVVYFAAMYSVFGLSALPYHIASLALYILNTLLVYVLLRRLGIGVYAALVSTTLFGLHVGFFHILAWISCIQQLMAMAFMLSATLLGLDWLQHRKRDALMGSLLIYGLGLMSAEQAYGVPVLLLLLAPMLKISFRVAARRTAPHWIVLVAYFGFMFLWKGTPSTGPYVTQLGPNVWDNLLIYTDWLFGQWVVLPYLADQQAPGYALSHVILLLLIGYNLFRRRSAEVIAGVGLIVVPIAPLLLLDQHTFYIHTYVPSFGLAYLIALSADDLFKLPFLRPANRNAIAVGFLLSVAAVGSFAGVRANVSAVIKDANPFKRSFVVRRAEIAKNVVDCIRESYGKAAFPIVALVYHGYDEFGWFFENVKSALGDGAAVRLCLDSPRLDVKIGRIPPDEPLPPEPPPSTIVFLVDEFGNCTPY